MTQLIRRMIKHVELSHKDLHRLIRKGEVCFGGNAKLKIYGTLGCKSGKRMLKENRVFFSSEAIDNGYRPCGNCLKQKYQKWKNGFI